LSNYVGSGAFEHKQKNRFAILHITGNGDPLCFFVILNAIFPKPPYCRVLRQNHIHYLIKNKAKPVQIIFILELCTGFDYAEVKPSP
jgi:hypothetical protein